MNLLFAALLVIFTAGLGFVSVIVGALMLTSANGPTPGNWTAHYILTYAVPPALLAVCGFLVFRLLR